MKKLSFPSALLAVAALLVAMPSHAESYLAPKNGKTAAPYATKSGKVGKSVIKSVDKNGKVIYSDRVLEGTRNQQTLGQGVFVGEVAPKAEAVAPASEKPADKPTDLASLAKDAQSKLDAQKKELEASNEKMAKQNCENARHSLSTIEAGKRVYKLNEKGETEYLNDEQLGAERQKAEAAVKSFCR